MTTPKAAAATAQHSSTCAVFCVCDAAPAVIAGDKAQLDEVRHSCWCPEGALTYRQFSRLHPKWRTLRPEEWLTTADGRAWHSDMQQRSPQEAPPR